jgi:hypothetical protein
LESVTPIPSNARIESLRFDDPSRSLLITLRGDASEKKIAAESVAAVFGARIRHEALTTTAGTGGGISYGKLAITAATGIPVGVQKSGTKAKTTVGEELHYALAMRVDGVPDVWYLLAASFNFRKALGPDATYAGETNLRLFVKRLAGFSPGAVQDAFFAAMLGGSPLPPPLESLLEFFKIAAAAP